MDDKLLRRINAKVNPFLEKLFHYPGKLFPGFKIEEDIKGLREILGTRDIIVEFGSGSGQHLIALAKRYPECLIIGFEIRFKRAVRTLEKEGDLNNLIIFRAKSELVAEILPAASVSKAFINFPDPWDKKRWLKHRTLSLKFFNILEPVLKPRAIVSVKTDHRDYYLTFLEELKDDARYKKIAESQNLPPDLEGDEGIRTEFERLFRNQGKEINFVRFEYAKQG